MRSTLNLGTSQNSPSTYLGEQGCLRLRIYGSVGDLFGARETKNKIVGTIAEPRKGSLWGVSLRIGCQSRWGSCVLRATPLPSTRMSRCLIRRASNNVVCCVRETHGPPKLPKGYRLEFSADPDAPALRRPDGTVVARFAVRGMRHEALEREALEDLLHTSRKPRGGGTPSPSKHSVGHDLPNTPS
jgi:hypothetical protein